MKVYTYWENPPGRPMPPYVALSIATMQRCMGDRFELLTPTSIIANLGQTAMQKRWEFEPLPFSHEPAHLAIVAKSDYVRLAWIARHGGIWIDADTIVTTPLDDLLTAARQSDMLHWSSEAFFVAAPGCAILREAAEAALAAPRQVWGNPGGVRDLVIARPDEVLVLDRRLLDPGSEPFYCFQTCEIMLSTLRPVEAFLTNPDLRLLKLYNTYFSRSALNTSLESFLDSRTLLARLFLAMDPDRSFWLDAAGEVMSKAEEAQLAEPA
jgi:hypothetical protein